MTILQGTMQDGTVLPVQVDAQGRLVAEGLQGAPGPAGPAGGAFALPANPVEGYALGWKGGQLVWLEMAPPVPAPFDVIAAVTTVPEINWCKSYSLHEGYSQNFNPSGLFDTDLSGQGLSLSVLPQDGNSQKRWSNCSVVTPPYTGTLEALMFGGETVNQGAAVTPVVKVNDVALVAPWQNYPPTGYRSWVTVGSFTNKTDLQFFTTVDYNGSYTGGAPTMNVGALRLNGVLMVNRAGETALDMASDRGLDTLTPGTVIEEVGGPGGVPVTATIASIDLGKLQIRLAGEHHFTVGASFRVP